VVLEKENEMFIEINLIVFTIALVFVFTALSIVIFTKKLLKKDREVKKILKLMNNKCVLSTHKSNNELSVLNFSCNQEKYLIVNNSNYGVWIQVFDKNGKSISQAYEEKDHRIVKKYYKIRNKLSKQLNEDFLLVKRKTIIDNF
jgi:hypothetical protein